MIDSQNVPVSIVMPVYNAQGFIGATLESVFSQTHQNFEVILIDDKSTDGSLTKLKQWRDNHANIQLIKLSRNVGPGQARNIGIVSAKYDLIALLDADDIWKPNKLSAQIAIHQSSACVCSCTAYQYGHSKVYQAQTDYRSLLKNNVVNTSTVMYDKSKIQIEFKSEYKSEDYMAWLEVAKQTPIKFINQVLVERIDVDGLSANKLEMAQQRWQVYRHHQQLGLLPSAYYFFHYAVSGLIKYAKVRF